MPMTVVEELLGREFGAVGINYNQRRGNKMATLSFNFPAQGRKLVEQFILDWITLGALLVVLIILEFMRPFHRQFYIDDPRISFPMTAQEQVPNWLCLVSMKIS